MTNSKARLAVLLTAIVFLFGAGYITYLAAGGTVGRYWITSNLFIVRSGYDIAIRDDGSGCDEIGDWDADSRTCTLTRSLDGGQRIRIADSGITFDGGQHTLRAPTQSGLALMIANVRDIVVRNLRITGYAEGIRLDRAQRVVLTELKIDSVSGHTINLMADSKYNRIIDNDLGPADWHGVTLTLSHGNVITGNYIQGTRDAVRLQSSTGNAIMFNRTIGSMIEGIDVHVSEGNTIILNDLVEAIAQPILDDTEVPDVNTYDTRWGGNYVFLFDEPVEGCFDEDADLRCDGPFSFFRDQSHRSLLRPVTTDGSPFYEPEDTWGYTIDRVAELGTPEVVCSGCHDLEAGVEDDIGPPLHGIFGRAIATYPDFAYSPSLAAMEGEWTEERLREFLRAPMQVAPGTTMVFPGIDDEEVVDAIVEYLRLLQ